jgi:hypothetical protein
VSPRITELYAYVVADSGPDARGRRPSSASRSRRRRCRRARPRRAKSLRPVAQQMANEIGKPIRLLRARELEEVETIQPE